MNCTIYDIQKFSTHDGPGIRTVVFFKGCTLNCRWCHNPESIAFKKELQYYQDRCIHCRRCVAVCPTSAHGVNDKGFHTFDRSRCIACFACVEVCYADALKMAGTDKTTQEIFRMLQADQAYYRASGGGVTFSGGECMAQIDCLLELLKLCRQAGIHTAVDTAGQVPWSHFEKIMPYTDLFLYDIKAASPELHRQLTGTDNQIILANLRRLSDLGQRIHIRVPLVPNLNDQEMENISALLRDIKVEKIDLLPYHRLGESKHLPIGSDTSTSKFSEPTQEQIHAAVASLQLSGIPVSVDA